MGLFSGISYSLNEQEARNYRQSDDHGSYSDFSSKGELKSAVKEHFSNYACPRCESKRVSGRGVVIKYGKVDFHKEVPYKGFFGGTKYRDELYKSVCRIHEVGLIPGQKAGFLDSGISPGRIYCEAKGCGWEVVAPVYLKKSRVTWYSVNDIVQGRMFKK